MSLLGCFLPFSLLLFCILMTESSNIFLYGLSFFCLKFFHHEIIEDKVSFNFFLEVLQVLFLSLKALVIHLELIFVWYEIILFNRSNWASFLNWKLCGISSSHSRVYFCTFLSVPLVCQQYCQHHIVSIITSEG